MEQFENRMTAVKAQHETLMTKLRQWNPGSGAWLENAISYNTTTAHKANGDLAVVLREERPSYHDSRKLEALVEIVDHSFDMRETLNGIESDGVEHHADVVRLMERQIGLLEQILKGMPPH